MTPIADGPYKSLFLLGTHIIPHTVQPSSLGYSMLVAFAFLPPPISFHAFFTAYVSNPVHQCAPSLCIMHFHVFMDEIKLYIIIIINTTVLYTFPLMFVIVYVHFSVAQHSRHSTYGWLLHPILHQLITRQHPSQIFECLPCKWICRSRWSLHPGPALGSILILAFFPLIFIPRSSLPMINHGHSSCTCLDCR